MLNLNQQTTMLPNIDPATASNNFNDETAVASTVEHDGMQIQADLNNLKVNFDSNRPKTGNTST